MIFQYGGTKVFNHNAISTFGKGIHSSRVIESRIELPPLKELKNINVLVSRRFFCVQICWAQIPEFPEIVPEIDPVVAKKLEKIMKF